MSTKKTMARLAKSKEHRSAYVSSKINIGIPFQIRALRKQRRWDQKDLASETGMFQPRISAMERPGYGSLNLDTLQRLAAAFDVALIVRFAPFSELIRWSDGFSPDEFVVPSFEQDAKLAEIRDTNTMKEYRQTGTVTANTLLPSNARTGLTATPLPSKTVSAPRLRQTAQLAEVSYGN